MSKRRSLVRAFKSLAGWGICFTPRAANKYAIRWFFLPCDEQSDRGPAAYTEKDSAWRQEKWMLARPGDLLLSICNCIQVVVLGLVILARFLPGRSYRADLTRSVLPGRSYLAGLTWPILFADRYSVRSTSARFLLAHPFLISQPAPIPGF